MSALQSAPPAINNKEKILPKKQEKDEKCEQYIGVIKGTRMIELNEYRHLNKLRSNLRNAQLELKKFEEEKILPLNKKGYDLVEKIKEYSNKLGYDCLYDTHDNMYSDNRRCEERIPELERKLRAREELGKSSYATYFKEDSDYKHLWHLVKEEYYDLETHYNRKFNYYKDKIGNYYLCRNINEGIYNYYVLFYKDEEKKEELIIDNNPKYELTMCSNEEIKSHELLVYQKKSYRYLKLRDDLYNEVKKLEEKIEICKKEINDLLEQKRNIENNNNPNKYDELINIVEKIACYRKRLIEIELEKGNKKNSAEYNNNQFQNYGSLIYRLEHWIN